MCEYWEKRVNNAKEIEKKTKLQKKYEEMFYIGNKTVENVMRKTWREKQQPKKKKTMTKEQAAAAAAKKNV